MANKLTIAEYEFGSAQWQFGSGEQIAIPGDDRRFLDVCSRDGKIKIAPPGILVHSWQEFERRTQFVATNAGASPTFTVAAGEGKYFSIGDIIHKRSTVVDGTTAAIWYPLGLVTAVADDSVTIGDTVPTSLTLPTYIKDDVIEIVGSALDEDRETLTTTKDNIITRQNSLTTLVVQRKISDRVNPPMFASIVTSATRMLLDKLEGLLILGKIQVPPQGATAPPALIPPAMAGLVAGFATALGPGTDHSTIANNQAGFWSFLKAVYEGTINTTPDPNTLNRGNRAFDLLVVGTDAMDNIYNTAAANFPSSAERLTYFRGVSSCSCSGKNGARCAYYDSPYGKLEVIVSPYVLPKEVYALKAADVALVLQQKPQLVMLPRTPSGLVIMMTCTATLEYQGVSYWWKGTFA